MIAFHWISRGFYVFDTEAELDKWLAGMFMEKEATNLPGRWRINCPAQTESGTPITNFQGVAAVVINRP